MTEPVLRLLLLSIVSLSSGAAASRLSPGQIESISKTGQTLGMETTANFPLREQPVKKDTGINILVDLSHQASFFAMWRLPRLLRANGFRTSGSQASLDHVLTPGEPSRIRIHAGQRRPFAWWPTAKFNVVVTFQADPRAQKYLPEEIESLDKFVRSGGGLVIVGERVLSQNLLDQWPLNRLLLHYGASFSTSTDMMDGVAMPVLQPGPEWDVQARGSNEKPVIANRSYGKGRIVVVGSFRYIQPKRGRSEDESDSTKLIDGFLAETVRWVAAGSRPVGGSPRLPMEAAGGGPIYPELNKRIGNVVVYYAKNQNEKLLDCVEQDMPTVKRKIEGWLPSKPPAEPMHLVLSAGGGGGWAVNAYLPKEVGIISLTKEAVLSVFAHELAHTMAGPPNNRQEVAGNWPHGNQGESHAGWFQGKAAALPTGRRVSHHPNALFEFDKEGKSLDLAMSDEQIEKKWGKGKQWTKIWWVWQKFDDRYGPTWYPRWRWVQHTRWQADPLRRLTWDETVEDMSIAVGEDLFPFFIKIGTALDKMRFERVVFMGKTLELPIAPLEIGPAGPVHLEPIGDYKKPLNVNTNQVMR